MGEFSALGSLDAGVRVTVRFFASLREALGAQKTLDLEPGATVAELRGVLRAIDAVHDEALAPRRAVRSAVNHEMCAETQVLREGDEVALFPPVTGG